MKSGIYTITNKNNDKIYVGCAVDIDSRWDDHKSTLNRNAHKNTYLQREWNKYGEGAFLFEVLEYWEEEYLCTMEHYWAIVMDVHNRKRGYNIRPTHPHGHPRHAQETRIKISKTNMGRKCPSKGKKWTPEEMSLWKWKKGSKEEAYKRSPETIQRMSDSKKGKKQTKESIEKGVATRTGKYKGENNKNAKPVYCYTLDGVFYKQYSCIREAAEDHNSPKHSITRVIAGTRKQLKGYKFYREKQ
jgi:group I intron endonuclease